MHKVAMVLVVIGALNWGLVGLFHFNLVMAIFGSWPIIERLVYVLVGVAAVLMLAVCRCCADRSTCCADKK